MKTIRIEFEKMQSEFRRILLKLGFTGPRASECAGIFAENSLDGINSHGVNRFPRFVEYIRKGYVKVNAEPRLVHNAGMIEQWDGQLGPGPLNAMRSATRAMELAGKGGLGCVALAHTNHWMRGGTYGWHAARQGFAFIGWTNTIANMPAWGATDCKLGNNPLVLAVPFGNEAIVLDFAMSQYSYGKMEALQLQNKELPTLGGYTMKGIPTNDPGEILESQRPLPVGFWKGAGLSLLLDIFAAILSGGLSTAQISRNKTEFDVSQVFIAFDLQKLHHFPSIGIAISGIISDLKNSIPDHPDIPVVYPGERVLRTRNENFIKGIPVDEEIWNLICSL